MADASGGFPLPPSLSPSRSFFCCFFFSFLYQTAATFRQIGRRPLNTKEVDLLFSSPEVAPVIAVIFRFVFFVYPALAATLAANIAETSI